MIAARTLRQESAAAVERAWKDLARLDEYVSQVGQLTAQLAGEESTWQERARASEQEARQLRHDLAAQGHLQQTLQQQLNEERKAREALAKQLEKLLKPGQQKSKGHD